MEESELQRRVAALEAEAAHLRDMQALLIAVLIERKAISAEQFRLLRRAFFARNMDKQAEMQSVYAALAIEEQATDFIAYLSDAEITSHTAAIPPERA